MSDFFNKLKTFFNPEMLEKLLYVAIFVVVCLLLLRVVVFLVLKPLKKKFSQQTNMLIKKVIYYSGVIFITIAVFNQLGFNFTALLGAAGILGIAIGFAGQTSMSNVISGIFLISEKPFELGDLIKVGTTTGFVSSIDLLSIKIRTFDNLFIRIPNESMIKSEVINITRFPIRRVDIEIGVAYKEDVRRVKTLLLEVARKNPYCLDEPEPVFIFKRFGDSALELLLGVWAAKEDWLSLKNSIMIEIKECFDAAGVEIPFPHLTLYTGSETSPFPVEMSPQNSSTPPESPSPGE